MAFTFKKVTTPLVLMSFLVMALFGFTGMTYGPDGSMQGDCPFSSLGTSLCPPSALPGAVHHLSSYQSFISVTLNFITVLLILVSAIFVFLFHLLLYKPLVPVSYSSPPFTSQDRKIKRWLSLFENSPSR